MTNEDITKLVSVYHDMLKTTADLNAELMDLNLELEDLTSELQEHSAKAAVMRSTLISIMGKHSFDEEFGEHYL